MTKSEGKIDKGIIILKNDGIIQFIKKLISSIKNRVYLRQSYYVYEWVSPGNQLALPAGFFVKEVADVAGLEELGINNQAVYGLIRKGVVVYYITKEDKIAHTTMIATKKDHKIDVLATKMDYEGIGYIGACETAEEHRGKGLYSYAITQAAKHLEGMGRKAIITTEEHNQQSINGIKHAGFKLRGIGAYTKILSWDSWKEIPLEADKK